MFHSRKAGTLLQKLIKQEYKLRSTCNMSDFKYNTLSVTSPKEHVYNVELNRPNKLNALNHKMWIEIGECFKALDDSSDCRVVILSGAGKGFCAGIDLETMMEMGKEIADCEDVARKARVLDKRIQLYQDALLAIEKCRKPVIASVHGLCIGGGFNMICGADIRYCSTNAWFSLKEVDLGMAADVGALQWLPRIIGSSSLARELAFTGRKMLAQEALDCGFVNRLYNDDKSLSEETLKIAQEISQKSPVAVQNTKRTLIYSKDHTVQDGLDYVRNLNSAMLQSEDLVKSTIAQASKGEPPLFAKL